MARRDDGRQYMEQRTNFQRLQRQSTIQLTDVSTSQRYNQQLTGVTPVVLQPTNNTTCRDEALLYRSSLRCLAGLFNPVVNCVLCCLTPLTGAAEIGL